jgi:hypothetical protein
VFIRILKLLSAIILLPTIGLILFETVLAFIALFVNFRQGFPFIIGMVLYAIVHYFVYKPVRLYVLAHELTHAAAAWSCGFRVKKMKVTKEGGSVTLNGSNAFIALAPYCVPLFAVLLILIYVIASFFSDLSRYQDLFTFLLGLFISFHLISTFETLYEKKQSDLREAGGVVFSVSVIVLSNCLMLLAALKLLAKTNKRNFCYLIFVRVLFVTIAYPQYFVYSVVFEILFVFLCAFYNEKINLGIVFNEENFFKDLISLIFSAFKNHKKFWRYYAFSLFLTIVLSFPVTIPLLLAAGKTLERSAALSFADFSSDNP